MKNFCKENVFVERALGLSKNGETCTCSGVLTIR